MKNHRSHVGRTRLILILLCIVLVAAMLWCALSLVLKIGTYSSRTVGDDKPAEEVPVEPADLEPTVAENSYDPAGFYEEGGFKRYKSADTIASVGVDVSSHQQDIDWELVAANGVEFAMIRVGYRGYTEGEIQPDDYFTQNIDAAAVYVNASTRFTDGEEFGFGAEIGISTQKLHARGPMGLKALTTVKYMITGNGQIRS